MLEANAHVTDYQIFEPASPEGWDYQFATLHT